MLTAPQPLQRGIPQHRPTAPRSTFRPEIEGLRALAVLLVMVFHIWAGRVSGGVDVFLVVSAFLLTGSFARTFERGGRPGLVTYYLRTFGRLLPPLALMVLTVAAALLLLFPESRQQLFMGHLEAAVGYVLNQELARQSVDYYAGSGVTSSPVQHVWSLSIQGQVFVLWPLILLGCSWFARWRGVRFRSVAVAVFGGIFAASLWYSVVATRQAPEATYFDATARLWEFAAGSLAALVVVRAGHGRRRDVVSWLGVALIVGCALAVGPDARFPGWISLLPVVGACLVLGAGTSGSSHNAGRALSWRPLVWVGRHSYVLYLWHWPLLITYLLRSARDTVSLTAGLGIMACSLLLTVITERLVKGLLPVKGESMLRTLGRLLVVWLTVALVLNTTTQWLDARAQRQSTVEVTAQNYPGAASLFGTPVPEDLPPMPEATDKDAEWTFPGRACTSQEWTGPMTERAECFFFQPDNATGDEPTVVVLGDSHARQFAGAVTAVAQERGWRVITYIMMGCRYSGPTDQRDAECNAFNKDALEATIARNPQGVVVMGTQSDPNAVVGDGPTEQVTTALDAGIDPLLNHGIPVLAVRDNARFNYDMTECLEIFGQHHPRCNPRESVLLQDRDPLEDFVADRPRVATLDLSDLYCPDGTCRAVIGNVMVYLDNNHITQSYGRTMVPWVGERMAAAWDAVGGMSRNVAG